MKKALAVLAGLVLFLGACVPLSGSVAVSGRAADPSYVYVYPDGSCWIGDVWYGVCPRPFGPPYGYYYFDGVRYYREPHVYWRFERRYPPPPHWRNRRHPHPSQPVAPPHRGR